MQKPRKIKFNQDVMTGNVKVPWYGIFICGIGALFYCYEFVLRILPGALQTELSLAFGHISAATFGGLSSLYYMAYSPMQMPVGMLMDRFGPRKLLSLACLCCAFGSFLFGCYGSLWLAGIGRFMVGFGSSFAFVGVLSLAMNWLPQRYFSLAAGLMTTLGMLGLIYGEMKMTSLAASMGLTHTLWTMVILGFVLTLVIFLFVRDGQSKHDSAQPLPNFFKEVWLVLTSPEVWKIGFIGTCLYTSLSVFGELWGKNYLHHAYHLSKIESAQMLTAVFLGWAIGAPLSGYISDKMTSRIKPLMIGAVLSLLCIGLVLYGHGWSKSMLYALLFFYGLFSAVEITVFAMAREHTTVSLSGTVFAATNMIVALGGMIYQPVVGLILDWSAASHWDGGVHDYTVVDYQWALSILPASLLLVVFLTPFFSQQQYKK